jgi:hypothetical protein
MSTATSALDIWLSMTLRRCGLACFLPVDLLNRPMVHASALINITSIDTTIQQGKCGFGLNWFQIWVWGGKLQSAVTHHLESAGCANYFGEALVVLRVVLVHVGLTFCRIFEAWQHETKSHKLSSWRLLLIWGRRRQMWSMMLTFV